MDARALWASDDLGEWQAALDNYEAVIARQGVARLPELDRWYREELPASIHARNPGHVTLEELARATEWKMARGVWRQRNLVLVRSNPADVVLATSRSALASAPDPIKPIAEMSKLSGVGPATASAIISAAMPDTYPFFDEIVARAIPEFGSVSFSLREYALYAMKLRERAHLLAWSPTMVERALWSAAGGKAGISL